MSRKSPFSILHLSLPFPSIVYPHKFNPSISSVSPQRIFFTREKYKEPMASISMAMPITTSQKRLRPPSSAAFLNPLPARPSKSVCVSNSSSRSAKKLQISASLKEKAITGLTAAALTASMVVPDVAEAAVTPSLKNFLLSIVAGGVVLAVLVGAVIGVANFDPVKRS